MDKSFEINNTKIKVRNHSFYYGNFLALKNISIDILSNKITSIIGPSGCGKSTFLRTLNRMNELIPGVKSEGKVLLDGDNIFELDVVELRRKIGMVFQRPNPFPKNIYENIAFGPKIHGIKEKRMLDEIVETSLRQAGLWNEVKDSLDNSGLALSGGQQQQLCIARALAIKPEVILMDEPASALDPIATLKIEELIQKMKEKYTIVIVTHNMQQAARASDYTMFFNMAEDHAGYLVESGETSLIFTNPKKTLTEQYISGRFG